MAKQTPKQTCRKHCKTFSTYVELDLQAKMMNWIVKDTFLNQSSSPPDGTSLATRAWISLSNPWPDSITR